MEHTLVFHLTGFSKKLQNAIGFKSKPIALSHSEANALLVINSRKETNQKEIATKLHLKPASVVSLIDQLEKQKLVIRKTPQSDRRQYLIILTEKGKGEVKKIKSHTNKLENYLRSKLSANETKVLISALEKLSNNLEPWPENPSSKKSKGKGGEK